MYAVGMLGSYLTQGVYAVAGPFQPFGGAVDIIVVQQEDGTFKSSPWYVKFGDFQGVIQRQEKIVDISVNDVPADFHMILDSKGEAYFEKEVEPDEGTCLVLPDGSSSYERKGQEGEIESVGSTDVSMNTRLDSQEAWSSTTNSGLTNMVDVAEVKCATEEERWETQKEQNSEAFHESRLLVTEVVREASQLSLEMTDTHNGERCSETASNKNESSCMELLRTQEERWEAKAQASAACSGDESDAGPGSVRVASRRNIQTESLEFQEVHTIDSTRDVAVPDSDPFCTNLTPTDHIANFKGSPELEGVCQDSLKPERGSDVVTFVKEDNDLHSTNFFAMEELTLQELSSVEVIENHVNDPKSCVKDDSLLIGMWAEDTFEGLETEGNCKDSCNVDVSVDEDEVLAHFERLTFIEGEREELLYSSGDGINRDSLSWDFESSVNQGLDGDIFRLSQSATLLSEEDDEDADVDTVPSEKEEIPDSIATSDTGGPATLAAFSSPSKWRLWPFFLRWSRIEKASSLSNQALVAAANVAIKSRFSESLLQKNGYLKWPQKTKVRTYVPTSVQLASLNLKDGPNKVTFTFSSVLGKTQVDARIYLWKWNTRIVISDVDGTITKSDVLGQVMPLVGRDWSQYGVTRLFSAIKDNGYEVLFLSARAISQAYLTRRFLLNLKQDGEALPEGPVFISPDGLIPSLYREVIRRAPHEFKISCLEGIRELFPKDVNPFYAGFGNRVTDEISYLKVGIPKGKIFIINPKGEVVVNNRVDCKSYTALHALVDEMFPPMSSHEQEEYNEWNFWKVPLPDIEDELSVKSSKSVKKSGSLKK